MKKERTLSIIKPDGVKNHHIGNILNRFENAGLAIIGMKMKQLTLEEAKGFYAVHKDRPFFSTLIEVVTSGPVVLTVLEGNEAIQKNRQLMGATDPKQAKPHTIRADFAQSIDVNTVHGSDGVETAAIEVAYFFKEEELFSSI